MEVIGTIPTVLGVLVVFVGSIWFLVVAFQHSILWGLGCLFIPIVALVFLVLHWDKAAKPFLIQLAGIVPMFVGMLITAPSA